MRLLFIALLLVYHSFAPFCGAWQPLPGSEECRAYFWIAKASYSFFLEGFVFISGFLAAYGIQRNVPLGWEYIRKKFHRLIVPSIIFSFIYFFMFYEWEGSLKFLYTILNGCGHLWFLPMLFWCFVVLYIVLKTKIHPVIVLSIATVLSIFYLGLPFRVGETMHYFLFFYLGYTIQQQQLSNQITQKLFPALVLLPVYLLSFIYGVDIQNITPGGVVVRRLLFFVSSFTGLMLCYIIVVKLCHKINRLPNAFVTLSGYSFGIYIFQQFILKYLYYYTPFSLNVNYTYMPWIGLVVACVLSFLTASIFKRFKIGRFFIG